MSTESPCSWAGASWRKTQFRRSINDHSANMENPMDRLTSLTVFTRVVDSGGFSAAAQRLGMSPTMGTNHMQALESRMGVRLLNRTTRKMSLTDVGRAYYE